MRTRRRRNAKLALGGLVLCAGAAALGGSAAGQERSGPRVLVADVSGAITPVLADHVQDAIQRASDGGYEALVLRIDTPGGLSAAMRDIVQAELAAGVPVVTYVTPRGARAASAGMLITMAAPVAAMSRGTTIGAATPVDLEGGEVGDKVVEDAAAYARAIAELRGRDVAFAVEAVRDGRAVPAQEALELGVIDEIARDLETLLAEIDGTVVSTDGTAGAEQVLDTADASVDEYSMSFARTVLQLLADPNLAFVLMSIGTLGMIYELATPGAGAAGVLGLGMLVLGLFSLAVLPISIVGLVFFAVAGACFVAELLTPGTGIFAALGAGALALAGLFTFRGGGPGLDVSLATIAPTVVVIGLAVAVAGRLALRSRHERSRSGASALLGRTAFVDASDDEIDQVRLDGAWWSIREADDGELEPGQRVRVVGVDGIRLIVEPESPASRPNVS